MKKIIDCETGEVVERELNAEEMAQQEVDEADLAAVEALIKAEAETKATQRQAILDRLGLTEDEARLLLG
jgi:hypothetical protein